ncbi:MAG: hypothetical protein PVF75_06725 [Granulosicoccaceae bacterium]|jgi:hypothetical protein
MQRCLAITVLLLLAVTARAGEWSGNIALEWRGFAHDALDNRQHDNNFSFSLQPEYYHSWGGGNHSLVFEPYLRVDEHDAQRTHFDIRALHWDYVADDWALRAGIGRVFWGKTESVHLVDIINQTDAVENLDGEDKLGQPMLQFTFIRDWGEVGVFVLPGARERSFPGREGRLRNSLTVADNYPRYASSRGRDRIDLAVRWSHVIDELDIAVSHFSGTSREPRLLTAVINGQPALVPVYDVIDQTGLELQLTRDAWLWKFEAISRSGQGERFTALAGGFEYTFYGVLESAVDVGVLTEYLYDDRGETGTIFENDLFMGTRIALNDVQSTELLAGVIQDLDSSARLFNLEASRRLGDNWKLSVEARWFIDIPPADRLYELRRDDYMQAELAYYF